MTFDVTSNYSCVSQDDTKQLFWKENLAAYQKSLSAFFQATLQLSCYELLTQSQCNIGNNNSDNNSNSKIVLIVHCYNL